MGEDCKLEGIFYSVNGSDREWKELAKTELPKLAPGGIVNEVPILTGGHSCSCDFTVKLKTIKKKRFIKLLMSMGYQRNEANKIHKEYIKTHKTRTKLGLYMFEAFYNTKPEIKLKIGGQEYDAIIKTNNM